MSKEIFVQIIKDCATKTMSVSQLQLSLFQMAHYFVSKQTVQKSDHHVEQNVGDQQYFRGEIERVGQFIQKKINQIQKKFSQIEERFIQIEDMIFKVSDKQELSNTKKNQKLSEEVEAKIKNSEKQYKNKITELNKELKLVRAIPKDVEVSMKVIQSYERNVEEVKVGFISVSEQRRNDKNRILVLQSKFQELIKQLTNPSVLVANVSQKIKIEANVLENAQVNKKQKTK